LCKFKIIAPLAAVCAPVDGTPDVKHSPRSITKTFVAGLNDLDRFLRPSAAWCSPEHQLFSSALHVFLQRLANDFTQLRFQYLQ
jgi:hypothetical protein